MVEDCYPNYIILYIYYHLLIKKDVHIYFVLGPKHNEKKTKKNLVIPFKLAFDNNKNNLIKFRW